MSTRLKWYVQVFNDMGGWSLFIVGYLDTEALAREQIACFQPRYPNRLFDAMAVSL